ncbi:hypothetical protein ACT8ZV_18335 [Nocardioides sp. MAHUQ-72]|uniref:hypothetical protein n=1 Tax=unclassified Nocardioides TaxID=2615069 RepID=UPI00360DA834
MVRNQQKRTAIGVAAAALVAGALVTAVHAPEGSAAPAARPAGGLDSSRFVRPADNPWFPLVPGTVVRYRGTDEGERLHEHVRVTHRTKVIEGVRTRVLVDVLRRADGSLAEKTHDWYAADRDGNVWYFGERTATYDEQGHLESREGSWEAGVDGARAGLIMRADPHPTDAYRQELYRGHAEDQAWIVQRNVSARTPLRHFRHALRSMEWSRLEPHVMSQKLYARGIGIVAEKDLSGGHETFHVVSVQRP